MTRKQTSANLVGSNGLSVERQPPMSPEAVIWEVTTGGNALGGCGFSQSGSGETCTEVPSCLLTSLDTCN